MWSSLSVTYGSQWFSADTPVSSTNKTDRHDITEILLKVALNTIIPTYQICQLFIKKRETSQKKYFFICFSWCINMDVYMYISVLLCWIREWNRFYNSVNDTWKSPFWLYLNTKYHVTSKYHHAPKQAWQTKVFIQCRYGLSGEQLFNSTRVWQNPILFSWPREKERALLDLADHKLVCEDHFETSCFSKKTWW